MRILVCEDDDDDFLHEREWLMASICAEGDIVRARDGVELLEVLRRARSDGEDLPRLILLDLNLPRMNGLQALEAVRADPVLKELPVIVMSTSRAPEDEEAARRLKAGFIPKPMYAHEIIGIAASLKALWDGLSGGA